MSWVGCVLPFWLLPVEGGWLGRSLDLLHTGAMLKDEVILKQILPWVWVGFSALI